MTRAALEEILNKYCTFLLDSVQTPPQCQKGNYEVVKEEDRMWNFESSPSILEQRSIVSDICFDDVTFRQNKWIRFQSPENNDKQLRLAENCPSHVEDISILSNTTFCQALYRGWIHGKHPTTLEG